MLLYSSFLFVFPIVFAMYTKSYDIGYATSICLATSVANHYHQRQHRELRMIDIVTMHLIGVYFCIEALREIIVRGRWLYMVPIVASCMCVVAYWMLTRNNDERHAALHAMGSLGVMVYTHIRGVYIHT